MKTYMPLDGFRWSCDSDSALCDIPQTNVLGQAGDINLMFHINDHTICREPLIFITSDKAMLLVSGVFHDTENVLKYDEFKHKFKL